MNIVKLGLLSVWLLCFNITLSAQGVKLEMQTDASPVDTVKRDSVKPTAPAPVAFTIEDLSKLYDQSPDSVYTQYLRMLIENNQYKTAEKIVMAQRNRNKEDLSLRIDLGMVYGYERKYDKAKEQYDSLVQMINGDDVRTQRIAKAFIDAGNDDYAIRTYVTAANMINALYYYAMPLARLYDKCGREDKTIEMLLLGVPAQGGNIETLKSMLLEMLGNDPDKLKQMQKGILKKINDDPGNANYAELLTWIYTQKNDWDGALIQI